MAVEPKIVAAIAGAINMYLQQEREIMEAPVVERAVAPAVKEIPAKPVHLPNPWALSGRQATMELRRMWQMRLVR